MADLSAIKLPDGSTYNLKDPTARSSAIEFISGTQTSSTGAWTGVASFDTLEDGRSIFYWLPYAGSGNATLNLTLSNNTTTGAINCYYGGTTRLTTHYGAGNIIRLTYRENVSIAGSSTLYTGWWAEGNYDTNTIVTADSQNGQKTGAQGIWNGSLVMRDGFGTYQNICTASNGSATSSNRTTDTTKLANTNGFEVGSPIWYSTTNYNANSNISATNVLYDNYALFDARYSFNVTRAVGQLTTFLPVYLVGTIQQTDGLFHLDEVWWTQTPNDESKIYILVGGCYDCTTSNVRINLNLENTWYRYNGTRLVPMSDWSSIIDTIYPVGSLYMTFAEIDPAVQLGVGSWFKFWGGNFMMSANINYPVTGFTFNTETGRWDATNTGGEATHTLTVDEMPAHKHLQKRVGNKLDANGHVGVAVGQNAYSSADTNMQNTGGGQPHNNLPPYFAVYMWYRYA